MAGLLSAINYYYTDALNEISSSATPALFEVIIWALLDWRVWASGLGFSFCLMAILGCHEMGHYLACRRYGVDATLPYFLPIPPPLSPVGTLGAFIRIRSLIPDRRVLFDIGVAGPIAGFIIALPVTWIGLLLSRVSVPNPDDLYIKFGDPLLMKAIIWLHFSDFPAGTELFIHPIAFAGWFGLLATAFNLLPVGQLDGGHMLFSWIGPSYHWVGKAVFVMALILSLWWVGWLFWCIIFLFLGFRHPRVLNPNLELNPARVAVAWLCLFILVLCFIPVPVTIGE